MPRRLYVASLTVALAACSTASPPPKAVVAASPPKDDGKPSKGAGVAGAEHAAALEQLKSAPLAVRVDKQGSVRIPLPDAEHWTRVRFLTVKSLVGFRYGKDHHAIVAGMVTHVPDNTVQGACNKSFEQWAEPWIRAFEVDVTHDAPAAFPWRAPEPAAAGGKPVTQTVAIVDVYPVHAKMATVLARESYVAAYTTYPVWDNACLVVGVAIPENDEAERAVAARDRFVKDVFPKVEVTSDKEPPERY